MSERIHPITSMIMRLHTAIPTLADLVPVDEAPRSAATRISWTHRVAVGVSLLAVTLGLQYAGGAFTNEYGGFPDEAAHFVTSLMVHDYVVAADWSDPMGFARDFYAHYPKIGLGHWPPVFYLALGAWMIVFGTSPVAVMLFITATTVAAAGLLYHLLTRVCDPLLAIAGAMLFVALPLVQQYGAMVMMESAMTFLMLAGVWAYAKYIDRPTWQRGLLFGVVAAVAILTKGTAIALGAIPPLAILLTRRFDLLKRFSFWLPAVTVAVLCAPWYMITLEMQQNGMTQAEPSLTFTVNALGVYARHLVKLGGLGLSSAALAGLALWVMRGSKTDAHRSPLLPVGAACLFGILALQAAVPVMPDPRHLIPAAPILILLAAAGIERTADLLARSGVHRRWILSFLVGVVGLAFYAETAGIPRKQCRGFVPLIEALESKPECAGATVLVSSNSAGEGIAIAEIARRQQRPGRVVKRASQVLSASHWDGSAYVAAATSPEEILALLDEHDVRIILLDDTTPDYPQYRHHAHLTDAIEAHPERFQLETTSPLIGQNPIRAGTLCMYRMK